MPPDTATFLSSIVPGKHHTVSVDVASHIEALALQWAKLQDRAQITASILRCWCHSLQEARYKAHSAKKRPPVQRRCVGTCTSAACTHINACTLLLQVYYPLLMSTALEHVGIWPFVLPTESTRCKKQLFFYRRGILCMIPKLTLVRASWEWYLK